ncbi:MAG: lysostaphin resistance A-like protein [Candidatus Methylacidiphilales bacterium]
MTFEPGVSGILSSLALVPAWQSLIAATGVPSTNLPALPAEALPGGVPAKEHIIELQTDLPLSMQIVLIGLSFASIICFCALLRLVVLQLMNHGFSPWNHVLPLHRLDSTSGYILMFFGLMYLHPLFLGLPAAVALLSMALDGEDSARFGLRRISLLKTLWTGLWLCLALMPVMSAVVWCQTLFFQYFHITIMDQEPVTRLKDAPISYVLFTLVPVVIIVAPVLEEFLFRGLIHPVIKFRFKLGWFLYIRPLFHRIPFLHRNVLPLFPFPARIAGTLAATFLTSVFFALIHDNLNAFLPLFVLGIALSLVYEYTGSIGASIALHAVFNGCSTVQVILLRALKEFGMLH